MGAVIILYMYIRLTNKHSVFSTFNFVNALTFIGHTKINLTLGQKCIVLFLWSLCIEAFPTSLFTINLLHYWHSCNFKTHTWSYYLWRALYFFFFLWTVYTLDPSSLTFTPHQKTAVSLASGQTHIHSHTHSAHACKYRSFLHTYIITPCTLTHIQ